MPIFKKSYFVFNAHLNCSCSGKSFT